METSINSEQADEQCESVDVPSAWRPDNFERRLMALDRAINFHHTNSTVDDVIETASRFERLLDGR